MHLFFIKKINLMINEKKKLFTEEFNLIISINTNAE